MRLPTAPFNVLCFAMRITMHSQTRHLSKVPPASYGPFILNGSLNRLGMRSRFRNALHCYSMWGLISGDLTHEGPDKDPLKLTAPGVLLLWPDVAGEIDAPAGAELLRLEFDVVRRPELEHAYGRGLPRRAPGSTQPPPDEVWGVSPPTCLPEHALQPALGMLKDVASTWWRSVLDWWRANALLGLWLADFLLLVDAGAAGASRADGPDWLEQVEARARRRVTTGVTVAEMAAWARLPTRRFVERYRIVRGVTPRDFLKQAKLDIAARLLRATSHSVEEVAIRSGYQSSKTFALQFKARHGQSPSAYRRSARVWNSVAR
jgi:AraC-like DNA-binding protein